MYTKDDRELAEMRHDDIRKELRNLNSLFNSFNSTEMCRIGKARKVSDLQNENAKLKEELNAKDISIASLKEKVNLYEKYISYSIDHDTVDLGEICAFNGKLYRMVSREDKKEKDTVNTVTCEFHCISSENDFKVGFNGGDKESNNAG